MVFLLNPNLCYNYNYKLVQIYNQKINIINKNKLGFLLLVISSFLFAFTFFAKASAPAYDWTQASLDPYQLDFGGAVSVSISSKSNGPEHIVVVKKTGGLSLSLDNGVTWAELSPVVGSDTILWNVASISADGTHLIVGGSANELFLSEDTGAHWTPLKPAGEGSISWDKAAMSADGEKIIVGTSSQHLYNSINGGLSWSELVDANPSWTAISASADGSHFIAASRSGVFTSTEGVNWPTVSNAELGSGNQQTVAIDSDGSTMLVGTWTGLYKSTDSGTTWSETGPSIGTSHDWHSVAISGDGQNIVAGASEFGWYSSTDGGTNWAETGPAISGGDTPVVAMNSVGSKLAGGIANGVGSLQGNLYIASFATHSWTWSNIQVLSSYQDWTSAASDADGSHLIAGTYKHLYLSSDAGVSWQMAQPAGDVDLFWSSVSISSDGTHLIAGSEGGGLYTSVDSGDHWNLQQPGISTDSSWDAVAISGDGTHLIAGEYGYGLYVSPLSTGGVTDWTQVGPVGNLSQSWYSLSSSNDGTHLIAGVDGGGLYTSVDSGQHWTLQQPGSTSEIEYWDSVSISGDGNHLIAAVYDGNLYISPLSIGGVTDWHSVGPAGIQAWDVVAISADGTHLIAGVDGGALYVSSDSGLNWIEEKPNGNVSMSWYKSAALSSDGSYFIAGDNADGGLFIGLASITQPINPGPTAEKFQQDVLAGFLSIAGNNSTSTSKVTFNTQYTITAGDVEIVFPAGTEMTKTDGGNLDLSSLTAQDITTALRGAHTGTIAGAVSIGIANLKLSFSHDISVTIPVDAAYDNQRLDIWYQNAGESTWIKGPSCLVSAGLCVFQTDHATTYSAGDQPLDGAVVVTPALAQAPDQAKIDSWSAYLFRGSTKCATKLRLNLEGKHFIKDTEVKIGSTKASSVDKKSSKEISVTFCFDKLLNVKTDLTRKITVTNPDTDSSKAKNKINLQMVFIKFTESDFDTLTKIGITNIQQALLKLKLLTLADVTGSYNQATKAAVINFQKKNNLSVTGSVGPLTKTKLAEKYRKAL